MRLPNSSCSRRILSFVIPTTFILVPFCLVMFPLQNMHFSTGYIHFLSHFSHTHLIIIHFTFNCLSSLARAQLPCFQHRLCSVQARISHYLPAFRRPDSSFALPARIPAKCQWRLSGGLLPSARLIRSPAVCRQN